MKKPYVVTITETCKYSVIVNAETHAAAVEEVSALYDNGAFDLDHNCFDGASIEARNATKEDIDSFDLLDD